jgi:hypothetical protein
MPDILAINLFTLLSLILISGLLASQWLTLKRFRREALIRDQRIGMLQDELATLMSCSRGVGASVHKQQRQIRSLLQRQDKLEQLDTGQTHYGQAITMLKRGADNQEITDSCGLSRGELDLIKRMNP